MSTTTLMMHAFFMNMNHPLMMMIIIIPTTIMYALILTKYIKSSWLSMILILILIGAMLILFMYMASLSPNEIMNLPLMSLPFFLLLVTLLPQSNKEIHTSINNSMKMFYQIQGITTTLLIIYLLLTMLIVINITNKNEGPLRSTYD